MPQNPLPVASQNETSTARPCARCETLPDTATVQSLHCWFPTAHVESKFRAVTRRIGVPTASTVGNGIVAHLEEHRRSALVEALDATLSQVERDDIRALFLTSGLEPAVGDLARVEPLSRALARIGSEWLVELLRENRLTSHFQPIVRANDPREIYAHEALLRGIATDGSLIPPGRLFHAARSSGMLFQLDLAARRSAIRAAANHNLRSALFVNFAPTAIYDPNACLRSTVAAIDKAGIPRNDVVFEIVETERAHDTSHLRSILDFYRGAGFRVAMDDVGSGYSSLNLIHELRPDIIKLDMDLVRDVHLDPYKGRIAAKLLGVAHELGIDTLVEGIESPEELAWVQNHGATWVQGFLFGRPAASPQSHVALSAAA